MREALAIYNATKAKRIDHVAMRPRVAPNFNSDDHGGNVIVLMGVAEQALDAPPAQPARGHQRSTGKASSGIGLDPDSVRRGVRGPVADPAGQGAGFHDGGKTGYLLRANHPQESVLERPRKDGRPQLSNVLQFGRRRRAHPGSRSPPTGRSTTTSSAIRGPRSSTSEGTSGPYVVLEGEAELSAGSRPRPTTPRGRTVGLLPYRSTASTTHWDDHRVAMVRDRLVHRPSGRAYGALRDG